MTIEEHPQSKEEQNGVHHLGGAKFLNDPPCIICMHGLVCVRTECMYIIKTCLSTNLCCRGWVKNVLIGSAKYDRIIS